MSKASLIKPAFGPPVLLTKISTEPKSFNKLLIFSFNNSLLEISIAMYCEFFSELLSEISLSSDLAIKIVLAPSSENFIEIASPIPFEAPQIKAVLFSKLKIINTSS